MSIGLIQLVFLTVVMAAPILLPGISAKAASEPAEVQLSLEQTLELGSAKELSV